MRFKKTITATIFLLLSVNLIAQNSAPYQYLNNMVQPAPNAAALGKYADYPVSYFTGVPNITIPLYVLKDGGLNVPISLSYHASGIRVSELATWAGLGWALNAGGLITRTVMGAPDEGSRKGGWPFATGPAGYWLNYGLSTFPKLPYPVNGGSSDAPASNFIHSTVPGLAAGYLDCEPDLYTFNFNGHVGKFFFDENRNTHTFEDDNLKINVTAGANGPFTTWTITTEDGIQYIFGQNNTYEVTTPIASAGTTDADSAAPSSWYLTSVINPSTKDTLTLSYTAETYGYMDLGGESKLTMIPPANQQQNLQACDNSTIIPNVIQTTIKGWRLTSIQSKNFTVQFVATTLRSDLDPGYSYGSGPLTAYMLDAVKIYNNAGQCIDQWALSHSYFTSNTNTTSQLDYLLTHQYGNYLTDTRRLKLLSVTESSGDGIIQKPPYVFSYNETLQLPRRLSYDQDEWGYCNNYNGNVNPYFTPIVYNGLCTGGGSGTGATRTSHWPDMASFTLTGIQNPLGATSAFVFEGNIAYGTVPTNSVVGGLRIKQTSVTDNVTGITQTKTYSYSDASGNSTGVLFNLPAHLLNIDNEFFWKDPSSDGGSYIGYSYGGRNQLALLKQSQSVVPLQSPQGTIVGYTSVKETFGVNGEGGYIVRTYNNLVSQQSLSSRLDMSAYTAPGTMNGISGLFGNDHFNDLTPQSLNYYSGFMSLYPMTPQQFDFTRGQLLTEYTYDSSGNIQSTVDNTYTATYHEDVLARGLKAYTLSTQSGNTPVQWDALSYYKYHTGISHLTSTTKKTYSGSNFVAQTTSYDYESPNHTLKTGETTTDSQGNTLINKTYYSFDYANTATSDGVFGKMQTMNLLEPVRTQSWKNGNLVDEKITKFYDFAANSPDVLINPANVYSLETSTPLTPAQANESITWSAPQTSLIPANTYLFSKVNLTFDGSTGKLISQQLTNDKSQGIQWSNGLKMPVAVVDNTQNTAALKEFYYEGFEESNVSNLYTGNGHTGVKSVFAPYTVAWTLPNSRSYVISYWYFANGIWNLQPEQSFTGSLTLTGGTAFDDIRIHPVDASMVTYTYDPNGNVTSSTDAKSLTTYYEYDNFQRLRNVRDYQKNIIKTICYNYNGQANGCFINLPSFGNAAYPAPYTRSCAPGYTGTSVQYTVPLGLYTSNISQQDADNQAQNDAIANGQNYANIYGTCVINVAFTLSNSTNSGYQINFSNSTSSYTYDFSNNGTTTIQVPTGTYNISVYPTGAYVNHTIEFTSQTTVVAPRTSYSGINVTPGSNLTLSIY